MPEDRWQSLMEVNLLAPERITSALLPKLSKDGRIVCVSSMSAIAGNAGQTNYATSKAGLLDLVSDLKLTARHHDQRRRAGVHRDGDDRGDAGRRARGGPADELAAPGRAAGRRRRDGRVAAPARASTATSSGSAARACWGPEMLTTLKAASARPRLTALPRGDAGARGRRVDPEQLAHYAHVCGFTLRDELPPTYPHVLAFGLHMDAAGEGAVQRRRRRAHREPDRPAPAAAARRGAGPERLRAPASSRTGAGARSTSSPGARRRRARVGGLRRPTSSAATATRSLPRRRTFEDAAGDRPLAAARRPRPPLRRRLRRPQPDPPARAGPPSRSASRAPIAHGMWTKARCLAALRLPDAFEADVRVQEADPAALEGHLRRGGRPLRRPRAPGGRSYKEGLAPFRWRLRKWGLALFRKVLTQAGGHA